LSGKGRASLLKATCEAEVSGLPKLGRADISLKMPAAAHGVRLTRPDMINRTVDGLACAE